MMHSIGCGIVGNSPCTCGLAAVQVDAAKWRARAAEALTTPAMFSMDERIRPLLCLPQDEVERSRAVVEAALALPEFWHGDLDAVSPAIGEFVNAVEAERAARGAA